MKKPNKLQYLEDYRFIYSTADNRIFLGFDTVSLTMQECAKYV